MLANDAYRRITAAPFKSHTRTSSNDGRCACECDQGGGRLSNDCDNGSGADKEELGEMHDIQG